MKRCISLFLSILMVFTICLPASAATNEVTYQEEMYQINFTDIDVQVDEDGGLKISPKEDLSKALTNAANDDVAQLLDAIEEFPSIETHMLDMMEETGGTLCAISVTEVPLTWVDDHYERIPANSRSATNSTANGKGKFSMYTIIGAIEIDSNTGRYLAQTCGSWSANSFLGGENYPATGSDYVLQSTPSTFSRYADDFSVKYNHSPTAGVSGEEFWRENGGASYIRYAYEDDPSGIRQCESFILSTTSYAPLSDGEYRMINSYYIHTWKEQSISVSVGLSPKPEEAITLEITPTFTEKSWQVYNYVTFNF